MESDQNQNTSLPIGCQGTCKTLIGCTCGKVDNETVENAEDNQESRKTVVNKDAGKEKTVEKAAKGDCERCTTGGCCNGTHKLEVYNWLEDMPELMNTSKMVEVQFKNTRKGYYLNSNNLELYKGDIVAVEATPGHDIGEVTLTGKLVDLQMLKNNYRGETKRIYRTAKPNDIEKWDEARAKEHKTMLRAREIAEELNLNMKISDVEYQGDGNKAIFYYIADERVDFRQLIKVYASEFRVKIEMKQIGARQEAGRVGGIGPCGRELCCSSSMSNFISVSTSAARLQDIPLNPQKLAGQCGKLKCCLNFEVDTYVEAQRKLPSRDVVLETKDASYYHFKTDVLSGMMTYSTDKNFAANLVTLSKDRVYDVIRTNKRGDKPLHLVSEEQEQNEKPASYDILQENITRFDNSSNNNRDRGNRKKFAKNKQDGSGDNNKQGNNNKQLKKPQANTDAKPQSQPAGKAEQPAQNNNQRSNKKQHYRNNRNRNNRDRDQNAGNQKNTNE
ncbi:regulatory iron-sulfur-containing complex subunit RicT [Dysgonomonas sp. 511]|uniref:PSP1 domain-containing protein n=1 Tax=Dysgonomonas sp. 511 TaxID=2302930 RepID=UPI0013D2E927|nr:regulatory iron-sulfur-containing complex subunit RicT [Dysgonomonas sp. 511]NDV79259.1 hypothetical protein [Dysgonomonas sp. 511]